MTTEIIRSNMKKKETKTEETTCLRALVTLRMIGFRSRGHGRGRRASVQVKAISSGGRMDSACWSSAPWGDDADAILALRSNLCAPVEVGIPSSRRRARVVLADEEKDKANIHLTGEEKEGKQKAFDASPHFTAFVGTLGACAHRWPRTPVAGNTRAPLDWQRRPGQPAPVALQQKAK